MSHREVRSSLGSDAARVLLNDLLVYPVHVVWPMGFSRSSAAAQSSTVGLCINAGIRKESILSLHHDPPVDQSELCAVATDDTILVHRSRRRASDTLERLDKTFKAHSVKRNINKDVNCASELTGLGCHLTSSPPLVQPDKV